MSDAVLIWREQVLPASETFIYNHVRGLQEFTGIIAGTMCVNSPLISPEQISLTSPGHSSFASSEVSPSAAHTDPSTTLPCGVVLYGDSFFDRLARLLAAKTGIAPRLIRYLRQAKHGHGPLAPNGIPVRLIHAHFANDAWFITLAAKAAGLPLVVTCHGYDVTEKPLQPGLSGFVYRARTRLVFALANEVIAVSEFIASRIRQLGYPDPVVRYNGIDTARPDTARPDNSSLGTTSTDHINTDLIFVGRLVAKKGVVDLLEAAHTVAQRRTKPLTVRVIGDGPLRNDLEQHAQQLAETTPQLSITFEGAQSPESVARFLRSAKIFVAPSTTAYNGDCEGFGQVFLEAARAGLPCVSRFHGGIPEAIEHNVTGLLSEEGDNQTLAAHITTLLSDAHLRSHMGRAGQRRVYERFALRDCLVRIEQDYRRILSSE